MKPFGPSSLTPPFLEEVEPDEEEDFEGNGDRRRDGGAFAKEKEGDGDHHGEVLEGAKQDIAHPPVSSNSQEPATEIDEMTTDKGSQKGNEGEWNQDVEVGQKRGTVHPNDRIDGEEEGQVDEDPGVLLHAVKMTPFEKEPRNDEGNQDQLQERRNQLGEPDARHIQEQKGNERRHPQSAQIETHRAEKRDHHLSLQEISER